MSQRCHWMELHNSKELPFGAFTTVDGCFPSPLHMFHLPKRDWLFKGQQGHSTPPLLPPPLQKKALVPIWVNE